MNEILHNNASGREVLHNNIVDASCSYCNFLENVKPLKLAFFAVIIIGGYLLLKKSL